MRALHFTIVAFLLSGCVYIDCDAEIEFADGELSNHGSHLVDVEICECSRSVTVWETDGWREVEPDPSGDFTIETDDLVPGNPVRVRTPSLDEVVASGSGGVRVRGITTNDVEIVSSGSGGVTIDGSTRFLSIVNSGSGRVDASRLVAKSADVVTSGSGDVSVCARKELDATTSGSGSIFYSCEPVAVSTNSTGSGSVSSR